MGYWGIAYVRSCVLTLESNAGAVVYTLPTKAGDLHLRAESFVADPGHNRIHLSVISVRAPDGTLLASAREAMVLDAIPAIRGPKRPITAIVSGVYGQVERLPDGTFDLQRYLPEHNASQSEITYSITFDHIQITYRDRRGPKLWRSTIQVPRVKVEGVGDRWIAGGSGTIEDVGTVSASVREDPENGLSISGAADKTDLAPLFKHLVEGRDADKLPGFRGVTADSCIVSGPVTIYVPKEGPTTFEANVVADARGFAYRNSFRAPSAHFQGVLTHSGLKGSLTAQSPGVQLRYEGALSWGKEATLGGLLQAQVDRSDDAPQILRGFLPKGLLFSGATFNGWLSYSSGARVALNGTGQATFAKIGGEQLGTPRFSLDATTERVALEVKSATWNGSPVHGAINVALKDRSIEAVIVGNSVSLAPLGRRVGLNNVRGSATVQALVTGTASAPVVSVRATGHAEALLKDRWMDAGQIVVAANYSGESLFLTRLSLSGSNGIATAEGTWNRNSNQLAINVVGNGLPLSAINADIKGQAAFLGRVKGTSKNPEIAGRLEVYGAEYKDQQVPLIFADVQGNQRTITAENVEAFRDAAQLNGEATLDLKSQQISGTGKAEDIRLSQLFGKKVAGNVDVPTLSVSGTLEHINVIGRFDGLNIVAEGMRLNHVTGQIKLDGDQAQLNSFLATFDKGNVALTGQYDLKTKNGTLNGSAKGLELGELAPQLPTETQLGGSLDGSFVAQINGSELYKAEAKGNLQNVVLNEVPIGSGPFSLTGNGDQWGGSLTVGDLDRYLDLQDATYDAKTKLAHAEVTAHNVTLQNLYATARPYLARESDTDSVRKAAMAVLPDALASQLPSLSGAVDAAFTLSGQLSDPDLQVSTLLATNLSIGGRPSGQISANLSRKDRVWDLTAFDWTGGPGIVSASGTIAERGDAKLSGEINNMDTEWLALFEPELGKFNGHSDVSFAVEGPSKSPEITASLTYGEGGAVTGDSRFLEVLAHVKQGDITASGNYNYNGLTGTVSADVPFEYPFTIPKTRELTAQIMLPERHLETLTSFLPWVDTKRTQGTISGDITVRGTTDKLQVTGKSSLAASTLAANGIDTSLTGLIANASFDGNALNLDASATGSQGGMVKVVGGKITLGNLSEAMSRSLDALLDNPVAGELQVQGFKIKEKGLNAKTLPIVDASLDLDGALRSPNVHGTVSMVQGALSIPAAPNTEGENYQPTINPRFNVALSVPNPVSVSAGVGSFNLTGSGTLAGTLALPNLDAQLLVEKGSVRLPNARINIDPGGTIHIAYRATRYGIPTERADVDLTGTTALTANPYGGTIQRYDINLDVRGDLLASTGLQIDARSDPPDLSQDRILMMLGQGGLVSQQPWNAGTGFRPDQLQDVLYSSLTFATDPLTEPLATSLGLDYLNVEYNAYEKVAVTAAKSFSKNLVLSARRQVSAPLPGLRPDWDIRLSYRLPFSAKLKNLNLSLGADQNNQWKIALEYGFRF